MEGWETDMIGDKSGIKRICIYGIGGVGGLFGGKMANSVKLAYSDYEIYFIARGEHFRKIRDQGLILESTQYGTLIAQPALVTDNFAELPAMDLILVCVKSYDLDNSINDISDYINDHTIIIPLLNGVDIYQRIRRILSKGIVMPGCVYVSSYIKEPGKVIHSGGDLLLFGKDPQYPEITPEAIFRLFNDTGINYQWFDNPDPVIWENFILIAAFGLVTAYSGKSMGEVLAERELHRILGRIMAEIYTIAIKEGVELRDTIVTDSLEKANKFSYALKTSLQRDVEQKKPKNESDLFGGSIMRLGQKHGVVTPVTKMIYQYIQNYCNNPVPEYF